EWLKDDINPLFPYVEAYRYKEGYSEKKGTFDRLFIARRPFPPVHFMHIDVLRKAKFAIRKRHPASRNADHWRPCRRRCGHYDADKIGSPPEKDLKLTPPGSPRGSGPARSG